MPTLHTISNILVYIDLIFFLFIQKMLIILERVNWKRLHPLHRKGLAEHANFDVNSIFKKMYFSGYFGHKQIQSIFNARATDKIPENSSYRSLVESFPLGVDVQNETFSSQETTYIIGIDKDITLDIWLRSASYSFNPCSCYINIQRKSLSTFLQFPISHFDLNYYVRLHTASEQAKIHGEKPIPLTIR